MTRVHSKKTLPLQAIQLCSHLETIKHTVSFFTSSFIEHPKCPLLSESLCPDLTQDCLPWIGSWEWAHRFTSALSGSSYQSLLPDLIELRSSSRLSNAKCSSSRISKPVLCTRGTVPSQNLLPKIAPSLHNTWAARLLLRSCVRGRAGNLVSVHEHARDG